MSTVAPFLEFSHCRRIQNEWHGTFLRQSFYNCRNLGAPSIWYCKRSIRFLYCNQAETRRGSENEILNEITVLKGGGRSEVETEALVKHLNW